MNQDRLMKLVPAGVVLAVAAFLGLTQARVEDVYKLYAVIGFGAVAALVAVVAFDYRKKLRGQGDR